MRVSRYILVSLSLVLVNSFFLRAHAQLGFDLKIDKPEPYDNRILRAEKTKDEPLKKSKKFLQNLTTHYNYFFNANVKLNEVIDAAKAGFKDDYTTLLPFYNYTLDATAQNILQLDSVIYKSKTGLVMHDLRSDWADNMYLLWGAAWFFEKKFDSAALMFQFINYAFAEKEKDGYYKYIGSRLDGNNALSIATNEKNKSTSGYGSRNSAFIWQARTMIESDNIADAGSLIATLKDDPFFPKRLNDDLEELQAYWYYKQKVWDSSAVHLINALDNAKTKQERARWEYLAAQMFERTGKFDLAQKYYDKAISHSTDPVMEVYARLNSVRVTKDTTANYIDKNIAELLKMAKRDKYVDYRDVIYYMAAQMEMDRGNSESAQELLLRASKYNNGNLASKSRSYLQIADLSYDQKKYLQAASFYDSLDVKDFKDDEAKRIQERKDILSKIVAYNGTIVREDSLLRLAAMSEADRTAFIQKLVKQLRKEQGLSDVPLTSGNSFPTTNSPVDLFPNANQQRGGEWYFYNDALRTQGSAKFKQVWGNRPNVDNWRRFSDVNQQINNRVTNNPNSNLKNPPPDNINVVDNSPSFENLLKNVPLTDMDLSIAYDTLSKSLFNLGTVFLNEMQDYPSAIDAFEKLRSKFVGFYKMDEVLFDLYYAYKKTGNEAKANEVKQLLLSKYAGSRYAGILTTGKDPMASNNKSTESTKVYENIYNLFIEGRFDEAEMQKKQADSTYKTNYWQPQLLYIEAVYHIRQRNDSVAKNILQTLIGQDPNSDMAKKAQNMIDVLNRRKEIEDELSRYQIQNTTTSDTTAKLVQKPPVQTPPVVQKKDTTTNKPVVTNPPKPDTTTRKPLIVNNPPKDTAAKKPPVTSSVYSFDSSSRHAAVIILEKVDPLFINEVKNAYFRFNREHYQASYTMNVIDLDADRKLLVIGDFANAREAISYMQAAKRFAPTEVIPWLKAEKYSFTIITDGNLLILKDKKDLVQYRKFLDQNLPGKLN